MQRTPPWNPEPVPHIIIQLSAYRILVFRADLAAHLGAEFDVGLNADFAARQFLELGRWSKSRWDS